jgi:hypothetical protein
MWRRVTVRIVRTAKGSQQSDLVLSRRQQMMLRRHARNIHA